jgi:hypothetical protein
MNAYRDILAVGEKTNSLGRADEVIASVYADSSRLDELFDCISADDAWVRMRAIDSFEKIIKSRPEWAAPYVHTLLNDLTRSYQPSIQWHLAQIFSEVSLTDEQRHKAIGWLKGMVNTTEVDWIVSVNAMKALLFFHQNGFIPADDIKRLFAI